MWAWNQSYSVYTAVNYVTDIGGLLNSQSTAVRQSPFTLILLSQVFQGRVYLISNYLCKMYLDHLSHSADPDCP